MCGWKVDPALKRLINVIATFSQKKKKRQEGGKQSRFSSFVDTFLTLIFILVHMLNSVLIFSLTYHRLGGGPGFKLPMFKTNLTDSFKEVTQMKACF